MTEVFMYGLSYDGNDEIHNGDEPVIIKRATSENARQTSNKRVASKDAEALNTKRATNEDGGRAGIRRTTSE